MGYDIHPRPGDPTICHLRDVVKDPRIQAGEFTYYHDFRDPLRFETENVLYHYPVNDEKLVFGKFCSIAHGAKFLFNGGNHSSRGFVNHPFPVFGGFWDPSLPVASAWDNKGDIVVGHDVWIGCEAVVMAGVTIGNGARIGTRAVVTRDVRPYEVVGGVPARSIKFRFDPETIELLEALRWWDMDVDAIRAHIPVLMSGDRTELARLVERGRRTTP